MKDKKKNLSNYSIEERKKSKDKKKHSIGLIFCDYTSASSDVIPVICNFTMLDDTRIRINGTRKAIRN